MFLTLDWNTRGLSLKQYWLYMHLNQCNSELESEAEISEICRALYSSIALLTLDKNCCAV